MKKNNPFICDPVTGVCGDTEDSGMEMIDLTSPKKTIDLYYVTDPICSHCWALEPVLGRFMNQYGHYFNVHTVMGGLLEKWGEGPVDPANGIYGPADVAGHWREVGEHARMPIDGSLMVHDPVQSSYPPSRVYKVIQQHHGNETADTFLRRAREDLFAFNQNISDRTVLTDVVNEVGLNGESILKEADEEKSQDLLNEDFALAGSLGARGFPTIIMVNEEKQGVKIVGSRSFDFYVEGLKQVMGKENLEPSKPSSLSNLLDDNKLLFSKEIEVMYELEQENVKEFIKKELAAGTFEVKEILGESYVVKK